MGDTVLDTLRGEIYKVKRISTTSTPKNSYNFGKGRRLTTFVDYYKSKYNVDVILDQPLIQGKLPEFSGDDDQKELTYLLPEFCYGIGITNGIKEDDNFWEAEPLIKEQCVLSSRTVLVNFLNRLAGNLEV